MSQNNQENNVHCPNCGGKFHTEEDPRNGFLAWCPSECFDVCAMHRSKRQAQIKAVLGVVAGMDGQLRRARLKKAN